ncbi:glycosyltransferase [Pedobacter sp. PWIIR3]
MENVTIITPCFNENSTVIAFLTELEKIVSTLLFNFNVVVVDDASTDNTLSMLKELKPTSPNVKFTILTLEYNAGHQRAIFQGLLYANELENCDRFIIMDSDGEDDPTAIGEILAKDKFDIIHVARGRRKEKLSFQLSYYIYRFIFKIITNKILNFGNYCMISKKVLNTTCRTSFVHFAAYLSKQRVKSLSITYDRKKRLDGKSKMNLTSLVHHAFKSFIEYAEELLMIFLKLFAVIGVAFVAMLTFVIYKKIFTNEAILGWASTMGVSLINMALICLGFFITGILLLNIMSKTGKGKKEVFYKEA